MKDITLGAIKFLAETQIEISPEPLEEDVISVGTRFHKQDYVFVPSGSSFGWKLFSSSRRRYRPRLISVEDGVASLLFEDYDLRIWNVDRGWYPRDCDKRVTIYPSGYHNLKEIKLEENISGSEFNQVYGPLKSRC